MIRRVTVEEQVWPYANPVAISRGVLTEQRVVVVTLHEGNFIGRGESSPLARFGESCAGAIAAIETLRPALESGLDGEALQAALPPGAARNAVDCALWDLACKRDGMRAWQRAAVAPPRAIETTQTIGLDEPAVMAAQARAAWSPLLKLKLGGDGDPDRVRAVREAAPQARLIVDANEAWSVEQAERFPKLLAALGVELIEQPLPASDDAALADIDSPVPFAADESAHVAADLAALCDRYDVINCKLDKTGGLTAALAMRKEAERLGLQWMVGCMGGTSLAMAPALLLADGAVFADLDGPRHLRHDRTPSLAYAGAAIAPAASAVWG